MAWHRDSVGLLFEKFIFCIISLLTCTLLARHLENTQRSSFFESTFYSDDSLYEIFIPISILNVLLLCKVRKIIPARPFSPAQHVLLGLLLRFVLLPVNRRYFGAYARKRPPQDPPFPPATMLYFRFRPANHVQSQFEEEEVGPRGGCIYKFICNLQFHCDNRGLRLH